MSAGHQTLDDDKRLKIPIGVETNKKKIVSQQFYPATQKELKNSHQKKKKKKCDSTTIVISFW